MSGQTEKRARYAAFKQIHIEGPKSLSTQYALCAYMEAYWTSDKQKRCPDCFG